MGSDEVRHEKQSRNLVKFLSFTMVHVGSLFMCSMVNVLRLVIVPEGVNFHALADSQQVSLLEDA